MAVTQEVFTDNASAGNAGRSKAKTADKFRRDVLCVRCTATIPEEQSFVTFLERIDQGSRLSWL